MPDNGSVTSEGLCKDLGPLRSAQRPREQSVPPRLPGEGLALEDRRDLRRGHGYGLDSIFQNHVRVGASQHL